MDKGKRAEIPFKNVCHVDSKDQYTLIEQLTYYVLLKYTVKNDVLI